MTPTPLSQRCSSEPSLSTASRAYPPPGQNRSPPFRWRCPRAAREQRERRDVDVVDPPVLDVLRGRIGLAQRDALGPEVDYDGLNNRLHDGPDRGLRRRARAAAAIGGTGDGASCDATGDRGHDEEWEDERKPVPAMSTQHPSQSSAKSHRRTKSRQGDTDVLRELRQAGRPLHDLAHGRRIASRAALNDQVLAHDVVAQAGDVAVRDRAAAVHHAERPRDPAREGQLLLDEQYGDPLVR